MLGILAIIMLGFTGLVLARRYLLGPYSSSIVLHHTTASVIKLLDPPGASKHDLLSARAIPNERLVRAFSLTNTFVSADIHVHNVFVGHANSLLRAAKERGWPHFQNIAIQAVEAALHNAAPHPLSFDIFVQDVTLRVALVALLGVDSWVSDLASDDIRVVTELITRLWSLSKKPDRIPDDLLPQLNYHLRRLITDAEAFPNPLDYVIPIWETLWRVVATTVAHAQNDPLSLAAFADMHVLSTHGQFKVFNGSAPSVEAIVMENMRLHPPSKHITRIAISPNSFKLARILPHYMQHYLHRHIGHPMHRECADIGTLLRSNIWGPDANDFDPLRHHPSRLLSDQEATKSLVFGYGRNRCIAGSWAPMAAGVIAAAVLDRIHCRTDCKLVAGPRIGARDGWNDWLIVTQL
jgi:hypothetical protein